ncbi:MAG: hypothetical protein CL910_10325 [Deltaproteobacteria bacterium]|jgi:putative glutamine amidotransferase|nr:hypothetical protein [Deltaproteobacteria bacterium]
MAAPRIAIALSRDSGALRKGRGTHYIDEAYASAVVQAGGQPSYLAMVSDPVQGLRDHAGLLLPGGDDFPPPSPYPDDVRFQPVDPGQRAFDEALIAEARGQELPILGICYGMQLLALTAGGRLHHHVPADCPGAGEHQLDAPGGRHAVRFEPGSRLARLFGPHLDVNSRHHQAVAEPGAGLRVVARADDGVVEALEGGEGVFRIGVQWHPETLPARDRQPLFEAFVAACRGGG